MRSTDLSSDLTKQEHEVSSSHANHVDGSVSLSLVNLTAVVGSAIVGAAQELMQYPLTLAIRIQLQKHSP